MTPVAPECVDDDNVIDAINACCETTNTNLESIKTSIDDCCVETNNNLSSIDGKLTSPIAVDGPLTDTQLRATPVPTKVDSEVASSFTHGQNSDIDSGANEQIVVASNPAKHSVVIRASVTNTGTLYIGGSGVSTSNGIPLTAGESLKLPIDDANKVYAIASVDNQALSWVAI